MTLEAIYFISQIIAAGAIVASLLFVGLQLRQSDKTQRALVHQSTIARTIELNQRLTDAHIIALIMKAREPHAAWNADEIWQMRAVIRVIVLHVIDMQWQLRAGLLDASTFDSVLTVTRGIFSLPGVRICWQMILPRVSASDRALVESLLLQDPPSVGASDLPGMWQTLATQMYPPAA
ncbi:MAG: hypothetical protein IT492_09170 [Gammaproteobacteria bacterium]|nr:hypothetical protein [Gammaproteobacteria bacterium]